MLTSHMNFSKIGGFGHSLLGSTSLYINSMESSNLLKGYVSLDIGSSNDLPIHVYNPLIPTLFLRLLMIVNLVKLLIQRISLT